MASKLLIVDDCELNRYLVAHLGQELGYDCVSVESADAALKCLKSEQGYGAVLMDIQMPGMKGDQAAQEIRRRWPDRCLKLIAMTADAELPDQIQHLKEIGFNEILSKPFQPDELRHSLES